MSPFNQSAFCAIFSQGAVQIHSTYVYSPGYSIGTTLSPANGVCLFAESRFDEGSQVEGFTNGVVLEDYIGLGNRGNANNVVIDAKLAGNGINLVLESGADVSIACSSQFFESSIGNIWVISTSGFDECDYAEIEEMPATENAYHLKLGDATNNQIGNTIGIPTGYIRHSSYLACNSGTGTPPIIIDQVGSFKADHNFYTSCGNETQIYLNSYASANANITVRGEQAYPGVTAWFSTLTGVCEYDYSLNAASSGNLHQPCLASANLGYDLAMDSTLTGSPVAQPLFPGAATSYTISEAGTYLLTVNITANIGATSGITVIPRINGVQVNEHFFVQNLTAASVTNVTGSYTFQLPSLAVGDVIDITAAGNTGVLSAFNTSIVMWKISN